MRLVNTIHRWPCHKVGVDEQQDSKNSLVSACVCSLLKLYLRFHDENKLCTQLNRPLENKKNRAIIAPVRSYTPCSYCIHKCKSALAAYSNEWTLLDSADAAQELGQTISRIPASCLPRCSSSTSSSGSASYRFHLPKECTLHKHRIHIRRKEEDLRQKQKTWRLK